MKPYLLPVVVSLSVIFGTACDFDLALPEPTTPPVHALTREPASISRATATGAATAAPTTLPSDYDATVLVVTQALGGSNASGLAAWLATEVALAPRRSGLASETVTQAAALGWLNAHWGGNHTVLEKQFVEHFVSIELVTDGWTKIAPIENGVVELHLHRYNAQGLGDPLGGRWRMDTILYE